MDLMTLLPRCYENSPEMVAIQEVLLQQVIRSVASRDDLEMQLDLMTATWGLVHWEQAFGIASSPGDMFVDRRAKVMGRMRGQGTTNVERIRSVAESFGVAVIAVEEEPKESRFRIIFDISAPQVRRIREAAAAIEEIKPAHLDYLFKTELVVVIPWMVGVQSACVWHFKIAMGEVCGWKILDKGPMVQCALPMSLKLGALQIWDTMWRLDGTLKLDGEKPLDADIKREVL